MEERLKDIIRDNVFLMEVLRAARSVGLPDWYVGAGIIRDAVWGYLHEHESPTSPRDIDVAYFDPEDMSGVREKEAADSLTRIIPSVEWEPVNQARVHLWYKSEFGNDVAPLQSTEDAIDTWPETVTCIGVRLLHNDNILIYAPYGLDDLFNLVLRRNPKRVTLERYRQRVREKRIAERWPRVTIIDG